MNSEKSWNEFRKSGLLFFINQILHVFGWETVLEYDGESFVSAYPARTKYRGFSQDCIDQGYTRVTQYLKDNAEELLAECEPLSKGEANE